LRLREWHKNALVSVVSCAFALLVAEGVVRIVWEPGGDATAIRADPVCGWALRPGASMRSNDTDRGLEYNIKVNALGLRDRDRDRRKPPATRRVLFLGDSMVFGTGVEMGERCSDRLEALLGPGVEVLNAGVGGWGIDQEFLYLTHDGFGLQPDVVILGLCVENDVLNDLLPHQLFGTAPKPRFVHRDGRLVLEPAAPPVAPPLAHRTRVVLRRSRLLLFVARHLAMLRAPTPAPPVAASAGEDRQYFPDNLETDSSHWSVYRRSYSPRFEAAFRVSEDLVVAMQESCAARRVPLLIFAFPLKVEVDDEARRRELRHYGYAPDQFDLEMPYARLRALAERLDTPFVYPLATYRAVQDRTPLFFPRDGHPNATGHALAAEALEQPVRDALERQENAHAPPPRRDRS